MIRSRFKPVFGVCINDADYEVQINQTLGYDSKGKQIVKMIWKCPYHSKWLGMVTRAYYANYKKRKTTYEDCNTVDEWRYFMNFRRWMEEQDWEGKELDKDLIQYENKIYGPDTCVFVPAYINGILFSGSKSPTRNLPLGVYEDRKNFMAKCHNEGVQKYLGSYKNLFDAHSAWQKEKIITIESKIERYKKESFANRTVVNNLYKIVDNLQKDFENNCITEKLYY